MYYKKFQRRQMIQLLKVQEGTVQAQDRQVRMHLSKYRPTHHNENTDNLVKHYRNERLKQVDRSFHLIIRSFCLYITTLKKEERYTQNTLKGIVTVLELNQSNVIVGMQWLLLIIRQACVPLTIWSELDTPEEMMTALTQHTPVPARYIAENVLDASAFLQIGVMTIKQPSKRVCNMATKICKQLTLVLVYITYTTNIKFYNRVIKWQARYAVKEARYTRETVDTTRDVCRFMHHAGNLKQKLDFSRLRKVIVRALLEKANIRIGALKSRVDTILEA